MKGRWYMKMFHSDSENGEMLEHETFNDNMDTLENTLEEIRRIVGLRRTALKNAEKKLQEFQDMMYAMIMEDERPKRESFSAEDGNDDE